MNEFKCACSSGWTVVVKAYYDNDGTFTQRAGSVTLTEFGAGSGIYIGNASGITGLQRGDFLVYSSSPYIVKEEVYGLAEAQLLIAKVLANKAVQNKTTGVITHYDDDGVTGILTLTPTDGESELTRTPS